MSEATTHSINFSVFVEGLDQSGTPIILLSPPGRVEHAAPAAHAMMKQSDVLQIRDGRLHLRRSEERRALREALAAVTFTDAVRSTDANLVVLRNREARAVMALSLIPLEHPLLPPLIVLRIANLLTPLGAPAPILARVFDLTPAEARISAGLLDGLDLRTIATREQAALETVRGHVKRAMAKTTAHSQAQFVRLLLYAYHALVIPTVES